MTDPAALAEADQVAAAAAEAEAVFMDTLARNGAAARQYQLPNLPAWLGSFIDAHNQAVSGPHVCCPHITDAPCVINVAVWTPGVVCCTACADLGWLAARCPVDEAQRCDVCHLDKPGQLHIGMIQGGYIVVRFAVCLDCHDSGRAVR